MSGRVVHVNDRIEGAVYIGRAMARRGLKASPLRNDFVIGKHGDRAFCLTCYRSKLGDALILGSITEELIALRGKPLACWCRHEGEPMTLDNACHGDVLLDLLERYADDELRAMVVPR